MSGVNEGRREDDLKLGDMCYSRTEVRFPCRAMIWQGFAAAKVLGSALCLLNRYVLSVPAPARGSRSRLRVESGCT